MKTHLMTLFCLAISSLGYSQTFTDSTSDLPAELHSGGCVAVTDMNGDGFDDVCTLDLSQNIVIYYQNLEGVPGFTMKSFGSISGTNQWGMAVGDVNNDGHKDVFSGGNQDGVHYCQITDPDNHELIELDEIMFMQCVNLVDIDNDGWLDAFGCDDVAESKIWGNDTAGNLASQNDWIDMATTPVSDNSGNYGSVWSDYDNDNDLDLFIAKCRQFVQNPQDPRRINAAFTNDGSNNFTDDAIDRGLVIYEQSWTVDFADIDNDGDFDCLLTNHSTNMMLFENDGCGNFSDISAGSGLEIEGFFFQAKMVDFDNDGYVDLLTSGGGDTSEGIYRNNGDNTFTNLNISSTLPNNDGLHSFGIGDLNKDGHLDIYASYGNTYVSPDLDNEDMLWLNDGNSNNFIGFDLTGVSSNLDAIGAKVQIYGEFGTQVREIRAGESYGITNSNIVHFGLGEFTEVDYAVIKWPSGQVTVLENQAAGSYYEIVEPDCTAEEMTVLADNSVLCTGQTTMISVDATGTVLWSNGMIGSSIEVAGGNFSAVSILGDCASLSNSICIEIVEEIDPTLTIVGETEFCQGASVFLEAPSALSYSWSNEEETQVIQVTESGEYSVQVEGACGEEVTSDVIVVNVLDAPESAPLVSDVEDLAGLIEVTAEGSDIVWFSDAAGENIIGNGSPFSINTEENITIYAANQTVYGDLVSENGGKTENSEPGAHHDNSANGLVFTAEEDIVIKNVKVFANGEDEREIVVYDSEDNVIEMGTFLIPDGESVVQLNFEIPAGEDYVMITTDNNPQLWRDAAGSGVDYPYLFGDLGAITGTTINGQNEFNFYYFFYDWNVESQTTACYSEIVPMNITIGVEEIPELTNFILYPNPASTEIRYEYTAVESGDLLVTLIDQRGRTVFRENFNTAVGSHQGVISVNDYAPGVYTFHILMDGLGLAEKQIIIE